MQTNTTNLWQLANTELRRAIVDKKHPFRKCVLSTNDEFPESRWVVLRDVTDELIFIIYTDSRSPKVTQIIADGKTSLTFYHPKKQLQVRVKTSASILTSGPAYERHLAKAANYPKDYSTLLPPGAPLADSIDRDGAMHFAVISLAPVQWDILQLSRDDHRRVRYVLNNGNWVGEALVP